MAIQNLQVGKHWSKSGIPQSYGNGTAMRVAPLGVFYHDDLYGLIEAATVDAKITHNSDEAVAGSIAIALAIYFILNKNENSMINNITYHLPESEVKNKLLTLPVLLLSDKTPAEALQILGTRADVRQTVPSSLYCYLKFSNYRNAVVAAIRGGSDCDTTGAITGALCGAKYGMQGIPQEWVNQIEDREKLIDLDLQLVG
jgi:poly(ADP-ribose) glycohydrolase ARH3